MRQAWYTKNPKSHGHATRKKIQTWHRLYVSHTRPAYRVLSRWHFWFSTSMVYFWARESRHYSKYFSLMIRGRPPPVIYRRTHIPSPTKTKSKFHEPLGWNSIITLINRSPVPVLSTRLYLKLIGNSALRVRMASQEEITNGLLHDRHDTRNTVKSLDPPPLSL